MALFEGEDLVDVQTIDGRTLRLPRSAASAIAPMQQVAQTPAGFTDETVLNVTPPEVPSVTGGQLPALDVDMGTATPPDVIADPSAQTRPDTVVGTIDNRPEVVAKSNKAYDKQQKAAAAYAASPEAERARVEQQTQGALEAEKRAAEHAKNVEAATQDLLGHAKAQHDQKIDGYLEDKARVANERFAEEERLLGKQDALAKKIANTKIDRKADHPILGAISIALAGLGSAMQNRYTGQAPSMAALDIFWKAIDRKVAGQMADLDLMEKTYGLQKDALAAYKEMTGRKLEVYNIMLAGEADKAKRHLETIVAKSAGEQTRANAKVMMAQIDQRVAAARQDAFRWGQEYDQKERAEKNQNSRFYSQLGQQERHHQDNLQIKREEIYYDYQKALATSKAAGNDARYKAQLEMVKDNEERGIRGVNGEFLLTKAGQAKMAQASQLEEQARALEESGKADPMSFSVKGGKDKVAELRDQAAQLRGEARITDVVRHRDKTQAGKFSDSFAAAQTVITQIDTIKQLAKTHGRDFFFTDEGRAELQAAFNALAPTLKEAWQLGAWDKGSAGLVEKIIGGDPSAWATVITKMESPDAFLKRLETVAQNLETGVQNQLSRQAGWTGNKDEIFGRRGIPENTPAGNALTTMVQERTPLERENAAQARADSGFLSKGAYDLGHRLNKYVVDWSAPGSPEEAARRAAETGGSLTRVGLSEKQGAAFDTLLKEYKGGDARVGDMIVAQVANNAQSRPDFALATLRNLSEHAQDLYVKARAALPPGAVAEAIDREEKNRIGVAQLQTPMLITQGRATGWADPEMKADLARRATTGDKAAVAEIRNIVMTKRQDEARAAMPAGSIFKGAR